MGSIITVHDAVYVFIDFSDFRTLGLNSVKGADSIFGTVFIIMWGGAAVIT